MDKSLTEKLQKRFNNFIVGYGNDREKAIERLRLINTGELPEYDGRTGGPMPRDECNGIIKHADKNIYLAKKALKMMNMSMSDILLANIDDIRYTNRLSSSSIRDIESSQSVIFTDDCKLIMVNVGFLNIHGVHICDQEDIKLTNDLRSKVNIPDNTYVIAYPEEMYKSKVYFIQSVDNIIYTVLCDVDNIKIEPLCNNLSEFVTLFWHKMSQKKLWY